MKSDPVLKLINWYLIDSPQPSNLSYLWNFGSLLTTYLVIQILTYITLMHIIIRDIFSALTLLLYYFARWFRDIISQFRFLLNIIPSSNLVVMQSKFFDIGKYRNVVFISLASISFIIKIALFRRELTGILITAVKDSNHLLLISMLFALLLLIMGVCYIKQDISRLWYNRKFSLRSFFKACVISILISAIFITIFLFSLNVPVKEFGCTIAVALLTFIYKITVSGLLQPILGDSSALVGVFGSNKTLPYNVNAMISSTNASGSGSNSGSGPSPSNRKYWEVVGGERKADLAESAKNLQDVFTNLNSNTCPPINPEDSELQLSRTRYTRGFGQFNRIMDSIVNQFEKDGLLTDKEYKNYDNVCYCKVNNISAKDQKSLLLNSKWKAGSQSWCKQKLEIDDENFNRIVSKNNNKIEIVKKLLSDHASLVKNDLSYKDKKEMFDRLEIISKNNFQTQEQFKRRLDERVNRYDDIPK